MTESEVPYGHVVEGDEIYSAKLSRWFTVVATELIRGKVQIKAEGVAKPWPGLDPEKLVRVRRGATGSAVDILVVAFSGERKAK